MPVRRAGSRAADAGDKPSPELLRKLRRPLVVRCLNPTTNKALHVGHIRNAYLGSATAACLSYLGGRVARHCILEDVGAHMAFAIHGRQRSIKQGASLVAQSAKTDHQAHAYYRHGREICTPPLEQRPNRLSRPRFPAETPIEVSQAIVPNSILHDWLLGSPEICALAQTVKSLALHGQSATLERFGVEFDYCDSESGENSYVGHFVELGIARGVFRRLPDNSVVYQFRGAQVLLRYAMGAPHENAYLLCFMHRCLHWKRSEWIHIAFAGREWAKTMHLYPLLLQKIGVEKAADRYFMIFHGMVTLAGEKMASRSGHELLADELFSSLESSPSIRCLVRGSGKLMSGREIVQMLIRLTLLEVPRHQDVEFSIQSLRDPTANAWRIVETVALLCKERTTHWSSFRQFPEPTEVRQRVTGVSRVALRTLSFESVVEALRRLCEKICRLLPNNELEPGNLLEMTIYLELLGMSVKTPLQPLKDSPSFLA
jgi:hypothetical protein